MSAETTQRQSPAEPPANRSFGIKRAAQSAIIALSRFVPQSLRSRLASSSYFGAWARRILDRVGEESHPIVAVGGPLAGHRMRVNWALHKTYVFETHEPNATRLVKRLVKPGWTVFDAGANVGYSTLLLAKCVGPQGKVFAFEPLGENFRILVENVRLNGLGNVVIENLALMSRDGPIELRSATPGALTWVASVEVDPAADVESQTVNAVSVDNYVRRHRVAKIDFIKIDVEGAESSLIEGFTQVLQRDKPLIMIELHNYNFYGERHPVLLRLKELRYRLVRLEKREAEAHALLEPESWQGS